MTADERAIRFLYTSAVIDRRYSRANPSRPNARCLGDNFSFAGDALTSDPAAFSQSKSESFFNYVSESGATIGRSDFGALM